MSKIEFFVRILFGVALLALFATSCTVRRSEPIQGPLALNDTEVKNGQVVFMEYCQKCHPIGESGLGPALNSNPAPKFIKRFQVRHGLGVMPSFSEEQISDEELRDITKYLAALRDNK